MKYLGFHLLRTEGLSEKDNAFTVSLHDVFLQHSSRKLTSACLCNFEFDLPWLFSEVPKLLACNPLVIVHGNRTHSIIDANEKAMPHGSHFHKPKRMPPYGTNHGKVLILVFEGFVRIAITTANMVYSDWNKKSQGIWFRDFLPKQRGKPGGSNTEFSRELFRYLRHLKNNGCDGMDGVLSQLADFDLTTADVALVTSVPGVFKPSWSSKHGIQQLERLIKAEAFRGLSNQASGKTSDANDEGIVAQFSSQGSIPPNWMKQFQQSLFGPSTHVPMEGRGGDNTTSSKGKGGEYREEGEEQGKGKEEKGEEGGDANAAEEAPHSRKRQRVGPPSSASQPRFAIVWPTVDQVRNSLEGYRAGGSLPCKSTSLNHVITPLHHKWKGISPGRDRAMPHIKTLLRYSSSSEGLEADWCYLGSHNLSRSAWGDFTVSGLRIRSYEIGVMFLPSLIQQGLQVSEARLVIPNTVDYDMSATLNGTSDGSTATVVLPLPYQLPPQRYQSSDEPWAWDKAFKEVDVFGRTRKPFGGDKK